MNDQKKNKGVFTNDRPDLTFGFRISGPMLIGGNREFLDSKNSI